MHAAAVRHSGFDLCMRQRHRVRGGLRMRSTPRHRQTLKSSSACRSPLAARGASPTNQGRRSSWNASMPTTGRCMMLLYFNAFVYV